MIDRRTPLATHRARGQMVAGRFLGIALVEEPSRTRHNAYITAFSPQSSLTHPDEQTTITKRRLLSCSWACINPSHPPPFVL